MAQLYNNSTEHAQKIPYSENEKIKKPQFVYIYMRVTRRGGSVAKALCFSAQGREFDPGRGGCFTDKREK